MDVTVLTLECGLRSGGQLKRLLVNCVDGFLAGEEAALGGVGKLVVAAGLRASSSSFGRPLGIVVPGMWIPSLVNDFGFCAARSLASRSRRSSHSRSEIPESPIAARLSLRIGMVGCRRMRIASERPFGTIDNAFLGVIMALMASCLLLTILSASFLAFWTRVSLLELAK